MRSDRFTSRKPGRVFFLWTGGIKRMAEAVDRRSLFLQYSGAAAVSSSRPRG